MGQDCLTFLACRTLKVFILVIKTLQIISERCSCFAATKYSFCITTNRKRKDTKFFLFFYLFVHFVCSGLCLFTQHRHTNITQSPFVDSMDITQNNLTEKICKNDTMSFNTDLGKAIFIFPLHALFALLL